MRNRLIDPVDDNDIMALEGLRCYNATTHVYYLTINNRYLQSYYNYRFKDYKNWIFRLLRPT